MLSLHTTPSAPPQALIRAFAEPARATLDAATQQRLDAGQRQDFSYRAGQLAVWHFGSGPRVLLQHGWDGCAAQLLELADALQAAGYAVTLLDAPAHGQSDGARTSVVDMGEALLALSQALGDVQAVVGHSAGSAASLWAMRRGLRLRASVHLCGPSSLRPMLLGAASAFGLDAEQAQPLLRWAEAHIGQPLEALDVENLRSGLRHPGLILHDPQDRQVPFAASKALHQHWPDSQLQSLTGLGHNRLLADRQVLADIVAFLDNHLGRARN